MSSEGEKQDTKVWPWILGGFASLDEKGTTGYGGRSEMMVKF